MKKDLEALRAKARLRIAARKELDELAKLPLKAYASVKDLFAAARARQRELKTEKKAD
jgi:hypothetical protein